MSYKRLNTRIKGTGLNDFDQIVNAFEAEGRALKPVFNPQINHPTSNYNKEIEAIRRENGKLGVTFNRLNKHQRHAVFYQTQHCILAAMVGSGKTTVLIAKIFYLHFIKGVPFEQMVVLTFTNKAAREIKERIVAFLGHIDPGLNNQLRYFGTFHSVARQLLEEHPDLSTLGYKPGFMILDEQEKEEFLSRLINQEGLILKYPNKLSKRLKGYKESGSVLMGNMKTEDDLKKLIQLVEVEKRAINSMDFDDLLDYTNKLLKNYVTQTPQWIIVDEFQDCNEIQLQLIEYLKGNKTHLFVVGDPNQSIYGWRGSKEQIFSDVYSNWDATWMELPQNYRSTENILSAAETLLLGENNSLIATRAGGNPISLIRHFDDQQEAYYLKEQMLQFQKNNVLLDTIAILFRTHDQIKLVENIFSNAQIPFQLGKRNLLYDSTIHVFLLRILKLSCNPNDLDACLAIICDPSFGALKKTKKLIEKIRDTNGKTTVLKNMTLYLSEKKNSQHEYIKLFNQIEILIKEFLVRKNTNGQELIDFLGLNSLLKPTSIHYPKYVKSIGEAWKQIIHFMNDKGFGARSDIFRVAIDQVVLEGTFDINTRIKDKAQGVHLLTIHAAKGLEFNRVYIAGANTGIIPLTQYKGSQNLKEEKRLLFVAITRGKDSVEVGWHAQPTYRNAEPEPSYFLNAIPDNLLNRKIASLVEVTPSPVEAEEIKDWIVGATIKHKKYGEGKIISVTETDLICTFEGVGEKSFSKAFANALLSKNN